MINISTLKNLAQLSKYSKGSIITSNEELFIIIHGHVRLYSVEPASGRKTMATLGPGAFFNHATFVGKKGLDAEAFTDVILLPISKSNIASFVATEPEMASELIKELCTRLGNDFYEFVDSSNIISDTLEMIQDKNTKSELPVTKTAEVKEPVSQAQSKDSATQDALESQDKVQPSVMDSNEGLPARLESCKLNTGDMQYLMQKKFTCPHCKKPFQFLQVRPSKLIVEKKDDDLHIHYKGIEPLYYDVVSCPACGYSALSELFLKPDKMPKDLAAYLEKAKAIFEPESDESALVFARYYLALACAPKCFFKHHMVTGKLYNKLSHIYKNCDKKELELSMAQQSLDNFLQAYEREKLDPIQDQQLCLVIGEMYFKLEDYKKAKSFFFKAKTSLAGKMIIKNHAEKRLYAIREIERADQ